MYKLLIAFILLYTTVSQGFCQEIDFNLKQYKLTDIKFRSFNNSIGYNSNGNDNKNLTADTVITTSNTHRMNYQGRVGEYRNTRKFQSNAVLQSWFNGYRNKNFLDSTNHNRLYDWNIGFHGSYNIRYYVKDLFFVEAEPNTRYNFYQFNHYRKQPFFPEHYQRTENTPDYSASLPIKLGYGRLERVEDARQALFLVEQLKRSQRLSRDVNSEDMLALASFVSKLRNIRFFDDRLQRIYQLKQIDSFFQANDFVDQTDAVYYTTSMDYWMFGGTPIRNNGARISAVCLPMRGSRVVSPSESGSATFYKSTKTEVFRQLFFGVEYIHDVPLSAVWQSTSAIRVYKGKGELDITSKLLQYESLDQTIMPGNQVHLSHEIGFYPTTRTWLTLSQQLSIVDITGLEQTSGVPIIDPWGPAIDPSLFRTVRYNLNFNLNYYISPRVRLNVQLNYDHHRVPDNRVDSYVKQYNTGVRIPMSYLDAQNPVNTNLTWLRYNQKTNAFSSQINFTYSLF